MNQSMLIANSVYALTFVTLAERPDLTETARALDDTVWPTFMTQSTIHQRIMPRLAKGSLANFQLLALLYPGTPWEQVVGTARSVPLLGIKATPLETSLPVTTLLSTIDRAVSPAGACTLLEDWRKQTALNCVVSITVSAMFRNSGLAKDLLQGLKDLSQLAGFKTLVAPVRPTKKSLYPLQGFGDYCNWRNTERQPFDPWIRTHAALGATPIKCAAHAMALHATLENWQNWTGLTFPESGDYCIPDGISPLKVDVALRYGAYSESRLWMAHPLSDAPLESSKNVVRTYTYRGKNMEVAHVSSIRAKILRWAPRG